MGFLQRLTRRRASDRRYALPDALWEEAVTALPFLAEWSPDTLNKLRATSVQFLCDKSIIGAQGFVVTPFHRVVVALQACIPILWIGINEYDPIETVVLYSDAFINRDEWQDEIGVVHVSDEPNLGEAIPGGPVVLSWPDALESEADAPPTNVVIHEFVHKLDMRNGEANGCPRLPRSLSEQEWERTLASAYEHFCLRLEDPNYSDCGIDPYAAEHPSEFFAVASETYFVAPEILKKEYPEVFQLLRRYYLYP